MLPIAILALSLCTSPPVGVGALPSSRQLAWHDREMYAFIHFGVNTFSDMEWGHGDENPQSFNPTNLDTDQWCSVFSEAGLTGVILSAKHHDGFCLWPSALTEHSVANSPWKNGEGDLLKDLSVSCKKYGLDLGVYLSPWDRNNPLYGTGQQYNEYFAEQLREILSEYGAIYEVWFDGACGEGPNGKRQVYDWPLFHNVVRELQPNACMFSDGGPDIRWIGNERGYAGETNWSTMNRDKFYPGVPDKNKELNEGQEGGTHWLPGEVDVSIRPGWFYHASQDDKVKTPEKLLQIWLESVGRNANLLLNFPIDRRGLVHEHDAAAAVAMKKNIDQFTAYDVSPLATAIASDVRDGFEPSNVNDKNKETYWATNEGVITASIELGFDKQVPIHAIDLGEFIELGQRVKTFTIEVKTALRWVEVATGTTIGNRRIMAFESVIADAVRVNITNALGPITLRHIRVYKTQPTIARVLDDDGGWCWFQDERCIVKDGVLYVGTVSSGYNDASRKGDINVIVHDLESGETSTIELHDQLQLDDHDVPALLQIDDDILAMWSTHGNDWNIHRRLINATSELSPIQTFTPDQSDGYGATYSNLFQLQDGSLINIFRGHGWDPNIMQSRDNGNTWSDRGRLLGGPGRPYVRYADDEKGAVHFAATEQHPRNFNNSLYHGKLIADNVKNSYGVTKGKVDITPPSPESLTRIFQGDADNVAWCNAIEINEDGHPVVAYSVQKNSAGMKVGTGGNDHRYRYAWFDGTRWHDNEVGFGGSRLYPREDDYTGLITIDPQKTNSVYFSSDVHPKTGEPLISAVDHKRHYEIWQGVTDDGGSSWQFHPVTANSTTDNIRPMMPEGSQTPILLWMEGTYTTYQNFDTQVRCLIGDNIMQLFHN